MAATAARVGRLLLPLVLAACGFHPMYATAPNGQMGPAEAGLAQIAIGLIPERSGQELRQALQERFERGGTGQARRYDLTVGFGLGAEGIGIQPDSSVSRIRMVGSATWTLTADDPQRSTLAHGTARTVDGYNVFDWQTFAQDLETDAVEKRITEAIADQITIQLAAYFNKHAGP